MTISDKKKFLITVTFLVVILDQILKIWVKTAMDLGDSFSFFERVFNLDWNFFFIEFTENPGMAFGMMIPGALGKPLLTIFRIIVVTIGIFYVKSIIKPSFPFGALIALGLIIGGAIGNIIDSTFYALIFSESYREMGYETGLLYGRVVDMFHFDIFTVDLPNWLEISIPFSEKTILSLLEGGNNKFDFFAPIFNIADMGIFIGIFMILLFYRNQFN